MDIVQVRARLAHALGVDPQNVRVTLRAVDNGVVVDATVLVPQEAWVEVRAA